MARFPSNNPLGVERHPFQLDYAQAANPAVVRFFNNVYAWMAVGLAVTAVVAWSVAQNAGAVMAFYKAGLLLLLVEIGLVVAITGAINRISTNVATVLFLLFSALNGASLSVLFVVFPNSTLASAFVITAGTFAAMSVYGMVTKRDLTRLGSLLYMALIGLVLASIVSIFYHPTWLTVAINYVGVLIFVGLIAFRTQMLKQIAEQTQDNPALASRLSVVGSLILYLAFINLFIFILRIMGESQRRD